jgi:hypothetical protein
MVLGLRFEVSQRLASLRGESSDNFRPQREAGEPRVAVPKNQAIFPALLYPPKWRGAVNTTRTFLIALEADPRLIAEFGSMR